MHDLPRLSLQVTNFCTGPTPPAEKKKVQQQALSPVGAGGFGTGWITGWYGEFRLKAVGWGGHEGLEGHAQAKNFVYRQSP